MKNMYIASANILYYGNKMELLSLDKESYNKAIINLLKQIEDADFFKPDMKNKFQYKNVLYTLLDKFAADNKNKEYIKYTLKHKLAIMAVSYELLGYISKRILLHDSEKMVLYSMMDKKESSVLHRRYSIHHSGNFNNGSSLEDNILEAIFDYECARYTKPDKPQNAYETIHEHHPEDYNLQKPLLEKFNLDSFDHRDLNFNNFNRDSHLFVPIFEAINNVFIDEFKNHISKVGVEKAVIDFNNHLANLPIIEK